MFFCKKTVVITILFLSVLSFSACKQKNYVAIEGDKIKASDYSSKDNWLMLPQNNDKPADIFYVYPTAWMMQKGGLPVCEINYEPMRLGAKAQYQAQASAFEPSGNIYAPYYRQLDAIFLFNQPLKVQEQYVKGIPKTDIVAAFDYFITHYNNGRPFILVGHSQGAVMVRELLFDYLKKNPKILERMIAAYVIGFSVTKEELENNPHLKFAENADDTGVIISYNTEAPVVFGHNNTLLEGSVAINPISWTRSDRIALANENLGSRLLENGKMEKIMDLADAKVDLNRGTVICANVDLDKYSKSGEMAEYFPRGVYHSYDIAFYYYNLMANAQNRVNKYFERINKQAA